MNLKFVCKLVLYYIVKCAGQSKYSQSLKRKKNISCYSNDDLLCFPLCSD